MSVYGEELSNAAKFSEVRDTVCEGVESITVCTELLQLTDLWQLNTNQVKK